MLRSIASERALLTPKTKMKTTGSTGTSLVGYQNELRMLPASNRGF